VTYPNLIVKLLLTGLNYPMLVENILIPSRSIENVKTERPRRIHRVKNQAKVEEELSEKIEGIKKISSFS
jgi:hypothetical protein